MAADNNGGAARVLAAPVHGAVIGIEVVAGQAVAAGQTLVVQEAMKMEVPLQAPCAGVVRSVFAAVGEVLPEGAPLLRFEPGTVPAAAAAATPAAPVSAPDPAVPRAALQAVLDRHARTLDAARPEAMARRHAAGGRSARENVDDLLDAGSFTEYGALAVAAQRSRRSLDDLQRNTPADGLVTGTGLVGGRPVAVMAYDYTVLAGTQGVFNHAKSRPPAGAGRGAAAAAGAVRRRRRRPAGRCRLAGRGGPGLHQLRAPGRAVGPGAAGGHRARALLRRQRGAAGLLRRDHRDAVRQHRHGRAGDDRRRRPGRVSTPTPWGRRRCRRPTASSTCVVADEAAAVVAARHYLALVSGAARPGGRGRRRGAGAAPCAAREPQRAVRPACHRRHRDGRRQRAGTAARLRRRRRHRAGAAGRAQPWRWRRASRGTWAVRWTRRPATSSRASCSWPTRTACRC